MKKNSVEGRRKIVFLYTPMKMVVLNIKSKELTMIWLYKNKEGQA